jgi:hypothetical protein
VTRRMLVARSASTAGLSKRANRGSHLRFVIYFEGVTPEFVAKV